MRQHELYDRAVYQYSIKTSISCLNNIDYFCLENPYRLIFNDHNARISDCGNRSLNANVDFLITDSNILIIIIYLYCRHTVHIHIKKMLNIYKNSNKNNNITK